MRRLRARLCHFGLVAALPALVAAEGDCDNPPPPDEPPGDDPCAVVSIEPLDEFVYGLAPDGTRYFENRRDDAGIYQIHVVDVATRQTQCITCEQAPGGPPPGAHKLMVTWHPSSEWLFVGGEHPHERPWYISAEQDLGMMQSGTNLDMYAVKPVPGAVWHKLIDYGGRGYTGPAFTADGRTAYYSEIVDGNIFVYTFGRWLSRKAEFVLDASGVPSLQNIVDITPPDTNWTEPGNISSDGNYLLWTLDTGLAPNKAAGMDQWLENLETGEMTNLNSTPDVWDEHGLFSPGGQKVVFMSSHPFPDYVASTAPFGIWGLYTEFMLMDVDGTNLRQLTHFHEPGYPEYTAEDSVAAVAQFSPDGRELHAAQLLTGASFPNQITWKMTFAGRCGGDGGFE